MEFDIDELKEKANEDYEEAWLESKNLIEKEGEFLELKDKASENSLFELIQETRQILLNQGFREVLVPTLIESDEIFKQYGPQASVILDRIFFLATLDRPDLGISDEKIGEIKSIVPGFDSQEKLESIFKRYKEGEIESDDLLEALVEELGVQEKQAAKILSLFKEFQELEPKPTDMTLRSHTTAAWFSVLKQFQQRENLPIQLFTIGPKYRREQKLDKTHLYESWTASLVLMVEEMSLEDGKKLTEKIMKELGFEEVECRIKSATSKYYAPETEFEVYVEHPEKSEMIEIGDAGFYSPIALAKYGIPNLVFNLGIGLERILMIRERADDIRKLIYPYQYQEIELSDEEIAKMIEIGEKPKTKIGKEIAEKIQQLAREKRNEPSPCEFEVFKGEISDVEARICLIEPEKDTELIGPAGFNEIFVYDGNIIGVPPEGWEEDEFLSKVRNEGIKTDLTYMEAFSLLAARKIEEAIQEGKEEVQIRVPIVKTLGDLNLKVGKKVRRYITDNQKKIDIRGPVFTTISAEIK
ncbi:MAG: O-phosphoserine--tRNA ligase [Hadesarchaea archaeon]|nr:O-phosphoserine--tRNA ligase [Hadesarchaea archaeon]